MFDTIISFLAPAVVAFLVVYTVFRRIKGRDRSSQQISKPIAASSLRDRYRGIAAPGSPLAEGVEAIMAADNHFDIRHFIDGAKSAYEMVVTAYSDGDRRTLTALLTPEVYEGFESVIRERKDRGETAETHLLSIDATEITAAELRGKTAYITLRFVSQLVSATRDHDGKVIEGDPVDVTTISDVWIFARNVRSRDLNWKIVATAVSG
jgi:predicted lipid-binding transport protein (Tim44 family)